MNARKDIDLKHIIVAEFLVLFSMVLWRINGVKYDLGNYDTSYL